MSIFPIQGVVSEDGVFVLGEDGILTEEEMHETLKVKSEFQPVWIDYDILRLRTNVLLGRSRLPGKDKVGL